MLGEPDDIQSHQLYQISYNCPVMGQASIFASHLADCPLESLYPPLAGVSVAVHRETVLQAILIYLIQKGWSRIALFYETGITQLDIPVVLQSTSLTLDINKWAINTLDSKEIRSGMQFGTILSSLESQPDGERVNLRF